MRKFDASHGEGQQGGGSSDASPSNQHVVVSQKAAAPLLEPVREFLLEANKILGDYHSELSTLYQRVAHDTETVRITTRNAACMVFGERPKNEQLYATHMALMGDGLRYLGDKSFHRISSNFRVRSKRELNVINQCTTWVRESAAVFDAKGRGAKAQGPMKAFIDKARSVIDRSRRLSREPVETPGRSVEPVVLGSVRWSEQDRMFIEFATARLKSYGLQKTTLEGLLPYVLRQTDRYGDRQLDATCAYDFLREIGVFTPWENHTAHQENQRVPGFHASPEADAAQARLDGLRDVTWESLGLRDSLSSLRKDWGDLPVFCIDDASAREIDDGFSVEKLSESESWIHVHIANPTAFLTPDHWIAEIARDRAATSYMEPLTVPMLPELLTHALGVADGAPVLTFSTKIDSDSGDILDINIQPATVRKVSKCTYEQLGRVLGIPPVPKRTFLIGQLPPPPQEAAGGDVQLSAHELEMLLHLRKCKDALVKRRARDGMISLLNVNSSYTVTPETIQLAPSGSHLRADVPTLYRGFPAMRLDVDVTPDAGGASALVAEFMVLANSALAQYATQHNIPLPFRTLGYNTERPEIVDHFKRNIMPTRDEWGVAARTVMDDLPTYLKVGFSQLLPRAGPHIMMGLPHGYCKATSPLRRYLDMVAHWNVQAHLLGVPLPFDEARLNGLLGSLDLRERVVRFGGLETQRFWVALAIWRLLQLQAAGQAGEHQKLPETMTMTVLEVKPWPTPMVGFVEELAVMGKAQIPQAATQARLKAGDKIEVSLDHARPGDRSVVFASKGKVVKPAALAL